MSLGPLLRGAVGAVLAHCLCLMYLTERREEEGEGELWVPSPSGKKCLEHCLKGTWRRHALPWVSQSLRVALGA